MSLKLKPSTWDNVFISTAGTFSISVLLLIEIGDGLFDFVVLTQGSSFFGLVSVGFLTFSIVLLASVFWMAFDFLFFFFDFLT